MYTSCGIFVWLVTGVVIKRKKMTLHTQGLEKNIFQKYNAYSCGAYGLFSG